MVRVLFVCMGNVCRSPMAEAIFTHLLEKEKLDGQVEADSAGTIRFHVGEVAHPGTRAVLEKHGINYEGRARQVTRDDLEDFDYIVAMDRSNLEDLHVLAGNNRRLTEKMYLMLDFSSDGALVDVPDPYYASNFDEVYDLLRDACEGLLQHIKKEKAW